MPYPKFQRHPVIYIIIVTTIKVQHITFRYYGKPKGNMREIGEFKLHVYGKRQF